MIAAKIVYKGIKFDSFAIYDENDCIASEYDEVNLDEAKGFDAYVCPWCAKKYGLFAETYNTPAQVDQWLENTDPDDNYICGIEGCENGGGELAYSESFSIEDEDGNRVTINPLNERGAKETTTENMNMYGYSIDDGGAGIVYAVNKQDAMFKVRQSYAKHGGIANSNVITIYDPCTFGEGVVEFFEEAH